jgi:hypothetical protein
LDLKWRKGQSLADGADVVKGRGPSRMNWLTKLKGLGSLLRVPRNFSPQYIEAALPAPRTDKTAVFRPRQGLFRDLNL